MKSETNSIFKTEMHVEIIWWLITYLQPTGMTIHFLTER